MINSLAAGRGERHQPGVGTVLGAPGTREDGGRPRVLIVDADPASVTSLREFLAAQDYEVLTATDGPEALQRVWEDRLHAVLLAICLPTMNGLEVLRQIRALGGEVPVLMVTRVRDEAIGRAALTLGACDYVTKPVDLGYLEMSLWHAVMSRNL